MVCDLPCHEDRIQLCDRCPLCRTNRDVCSAEHVTYTDKDQKSEEVEHDFLGQKVLLVDQVLGVQWASLHFDFFV